MADTTNLPPLTIEEEDEIFYHESAVNAAWTGARLFIGGMTFLLGAFAYCYFYLRSINSGGRWEGPGFVHPSMTVGTIVMLLIFASAGLHYGGLTRIKAGHKGTWQLGGVLALLLGLAAIGLQITELDTLPFLPGSSGYASVFTGFYAVFVAVLFAMMVWLEILLARSRQIPAVSFAEQPPTHAEMFKVQRFQANLSAFSTVWSYMAIMALGFWFLFYAF